MLDQNKTDFNDVFAPNGDYGAAAQTAANDSPYGEAGQAAANDAPYGGSELPEKEKDEDLGEQSKLVVLRSILMDLKVNLEKAIKIIDEENLVYSGSRKPLSDYTEKLGEIAATFTAAGEKALAREEKTEESGKVIEGVFDGQNMIGPEGKQYSVPANYASKSKLVEGDIMKLTIARDGTFLYKQIGPTERKRGLGILTLDDDTNNYYVLSEGRKYRILTASVTYFKGRPGDEVVIILPKDGESAWAAVENIIRK